ncbi:tRNA nucleotidyltransferase [Pseudoalteromonas rubra]|uniref:tRNA nucleotidyltransferase n=1 Tax=Pseudoalteromonas rubra TaxID=43658 RepID=A0A5S3WPD2_9GAMM|nr:tRNA nucleotidyltransferase [Pseudoalteromonas rubra]TMP29296.1 tRNA nucleotidyltransferase [Pseudoalteromonas rubra]TMP34099.1 tRNA nucleotidyltransferase [Pseudoalteromonas rubra]
MKIYLVGGAVRDQLLGRPILERDYVVVGATPEQMQSLGYQQVGKDFPVFLHPQSKDEHALARTERKQGQGYTGFICDFAPSITLEEDLMRRDLTVNAIAQDEDGTLIDPYQGQRDLEARILRHVSDAFAEDPLRVLRVARFAARYHHLGFTISPETQALMHRMVDEGELTTLTKERVWLEIEKSLKDGAIEVFSEALASLNALHLVLPWLTNWTKQNSTVLQSRIAQLDKQDPDFLTVSFALWQQDAQLEGYNLEQDYKIPKAYSEALRDLQTALPLLQGPDWQPATIMQLFSALDASRRPQRLTLLCKAARTFSDELAQRCDMLAQALHLAAQVKAQDVIAKGVKGPQIKVEMDKLKEQSISALFNT